MPAAAATVPPDEPSKPGALNGAPPAITAAILAYLAVSVPVIGLYALWRRYAGAP